MVLNILVNSLKSTKIPCDRKVIFQTRVDRRKRHIILFTLCQTSYKVKYMHSSLRQHIKVLSQEIINEVLVGI